MYASKNIFSNVSEKRMHLKQQCNFSIRLIQKGPTKANACLHQSQHFTIKT